MVASPWLDAGSQNPEADTVAVGLPARKFCQPSENAVISVSGTVKVSVTLDNSSSNATESKLKSESLPCVLAPTSPPYY